jgi:hypothetical protein
MKVKEDYVIGAIYSVKGPDFPVAIWTGSSYLGLGKDAYDRMDFIELAPWEDGPPFGSITNVKRLGDFVVPSPWNTPTVKAFLDALNELAWEASI